MSTFNNTTWTLPEDARKAGMKYPNYNIVNTPSGHKIVYDDSEGSESITIEHRSGSAIQFQADGSIVFKSQKDKYEVVFGDNNMLVTGAQNLTVNGGCQVKIEGDYDMNIHGDLKQTVNGNHEMVVNGDQISAIKGKQETVVGGNHSIKVAGKAELNANKTLVAAETELSTYAGATMSIVAVETVGLKAAEFAMVKG